MKKLITIAVALCALNAPRVHAQWTVFDPTMYLQQILNQAQSMAKYVQMIENQTQQIQALTQQLEEFKHYESLFGDPKSVTVPVTPMLAADLRKIEPGKNLEDLIQVADGAFALTYNASGLYHTVGETFTTPAGQTVTRPVDQFRPYAAVSRTAENYVTSAADAAARRAAIKTQIAQTADQLQSATTDAEVQKLSGVLTGLSADLASTDAQVNQALASALVQDIQNRNDERKQTEALTEQQNAEFQEAVANYGRKFQLMTRPTPFPNR